jgi:hypothetical protein
VTERESHQKVRPYSKPTLTMFGKITELTTLVANMQAFDSGATGSGAPKTGTV